MAPLYKPKEKKRFTESIALADVLMKTVWLQNFQWNNLRLKYGTDFLSRLSENGLFVFPTHEEV
jgi:hypothetical protein